MQTPLDLAISAAAVAEATYLAKLDGVAGINAAIAADSSPLPAAISDLADAASGFNTSLQQLAAMALSAVVPPAAPPSLVIVPPVDPAVAGTGGSN